MEPVKLATDDLEAMSVGRAARVLGITRMTLYRWIEAGKVDTFNVGGILFLHGEEVDRLMKKPTAGKP